MTTATTFQADTQTGLPEMIRAFATSVRAALTARRERARLHAELAQCSDRELADMNISRADIGHIVRNWQPA